MAPYAEGCRQKLEADTHRVAAALRAWYEHELTEGSYAPGYCHEMARDCAAALQQLGAYGGDYGYPAYDRRYFNAVRPSGYTRSLAELGLPELAGLRGLEAEQRGVALVMERSQAEFTLHVDLFDFGQSIISDPAPATGSPLARRDVRTCLTSVQDALRSRKTSLDLLWVVRRSLVTVLTAGTWADAGLPSACIERWWGDRGELTASAVAIVALACLGATQGSCLAAKGVFAASTGWNKQPIIDLPERPIVFRTRDEFAIGNGAVVASFKRRAGHAVLAWIDEDRPLSGLLADMALERWERTTVELGGESDGHSVLRFEQHASLAETLRQYDRMAQRTRALDPHCARSPRFFVFAAEGVRNSPDGMRPSSELRFASSRDTFLQRVNFPSVRKSVQVTRFAARRSMALMSPDSGNGTAVLWRHYLNTPDLKAALLSGSKFLQTVMEGLILGRRPSVANAVGVEQDVLRWLSSVSHASTIAAAFGVMPSTDPPGSIATGVAPTPAVLGELFLTHWACRKAACTLSPATWQVRCFPVLVVCKAIGRMICEAGLRPDYVAAARTAHRALLAGEVPLPPVDVA